MIPSITRYARASDLDHALELLAEPDASAIAGGQSLIPAMKLRVARPALVVDISHLELRGVEERDAALHIGALTTWSELLDSSHLDRPALAAIKECARGIGDLQVRNLGTIGGSVAHAHPASDMPAVLLALNATLRLRSPSGTRELSFAEILVGPFTTALGRQELVTAIVVPLPAAWVGVRVRLGRAPRVGLRTRRCRRARRSERRHRGGHWHRSDAVPPVSSEHPRRPRRDRDLR